MPHLTLEYSPGLAARADIPALCRVLHSAICEAGIFPLGGIRVRAYCADHAIVGDGLPENDFAALGFAVASGRSPEALRAAGDLIFTAATRALAEPLATPHFTLSFEIREINPDLSWKQNSIHARLAGQTEGAAHG
ncbi:5-carboxymethyl-2-hydroxymuconate isomerase [Thioclava sp. BHET1]|nr:5-carboxymethyl-2-hydroxymuconate isomerase [Thioclava sp. BHET1]